MSPQHVNLLRGPARLLDMDQETPNPQPPHPQEPPASPAAVRVVTQLQVGDIFRWLRAGARDWVAHPWIAGFYGLCFWAMALALGWMFRASPEYVMSLASGCLLVGPFMAMGLYEASRRHACGERLRLQDSLWCWKPHLPSMGTLALVLLVLELLWGRASLVVFAVFFQTGLPSTASVMQAILSPDNLEFVLAYMLVGSVFAACVYAMSVVSIPLILDRGTDAITAGITSLEVVLQNPLVMALWGVFITLTVALALLLPWSVGLVVLGPWLGHASWHAYRGSVQWSDPLP